jgi:hypothetical protein
MDFVFINPSEIATRFFPLFERNLTFGVKQTEDYVIPYDKLVVNNLPHLDNTFNGAFKSIAWDKSGVELQTNYHSLEFDLDEYQNNSVPNGVVLLDMLCHQRHYAVTSQWFRENGAWSLQRNADLNNDKDKYKELAIAEIEKRGLSGPVQTYIHPDNSVKFKLHPIDMAYIVSKNIVNRHWITIWPTVITLRTSPDESLFAFKSWIEKTSI